MKTTYIVIAVIILGALGYYFFMPTPTPSETPTDTSSQAKVDINAVCDGALAYMTFPSGAEAEVFVQECKEGKHPEVVEKYKADLNLGAGVEI